MVYHINHKIGSDRHKKRECSCPFKRYDGMCSEKSNFPNQRCAVLNHTQKCLVHSSGSKFFFFVGQEITVSSSLQHHQGIQS